MYFENGIIIRIEWNRIGISNNHSFEDSKYFRTVTPCNDIVGPPINAQNLHWDLSVRKFNSKILKREEAKV